MDILFNNPLGSMYGPTFLMLYAIFVIAVITILVIGKRLVDSSSKLPSPNIPSPIDPFEIAYLRGKEEELARSVIFSLIQKKYLEISEDNATIKRINTTYSDSGLSKIEQITLNWIGNQRSTSEVFGSGGLVKQLVSYGISYKQKLEQQELLISNSTQWKYTILKFLGVCAIWGFGLYKILAAFYNGKYNVAFIVLLGVIGFIITLFLHLPRISKLGEEYLEKLQLAFSSLRSTINSVETNSPNKLVDQQTTFAGVDPFLLSVGVFGGGIWLEQSMIVTIKHLLNRQI